MFLFLFVSMSSCFCFFCMEPATTGFYTYLHTLSLHDALPISPRDDRDLDICACCREGLVERVDLVERQRLVLVGEEDVDLVGDEVAPLRSVTFDRSEEHTSELQSLMRISYAVFCLKKKKTITHAKVIQTSKNDEN